MRIILLSHILDETDGSKTHLESKVIHIEVLLHIVTNTLGNKCVGRWGGQACKRVKVGVRKWVGALHTPSKFDSTLHQR